MLAGPARRLQLKLYCRAALLCCASDQRPAEVAHTVGAACRAHRSSLGAATLPHHLSLLLSANQRPANDCSGPTRAAATAAIVVCWSSLCARALLSRWRTQQIQLGSQVALQCSARCNRSSGSATGQARAEPTAAAETAAAANQRSFAQNSLAPPTCSPGAPRLPAPIRSQGERARARASCGQADTNYWLAGAQQSAGANKPPASCSALVVAAILASVSAASAILANFGCSLVAVQLQCGDNGQQRQNKGDSKSLALLPANGEQRTAKVSGKI